MRTLPHGRPALAAGVLLLALVGCANDGSPTASGSAEVAGASGAPSGAPSGATGSRAAPSGRAGAGGGTASEAPGGGSGEAAGPGSPTTGDIPAIVAQVQPSVVTIRREGGEGSGVIWSAEGDIVTNHHVIEGADEVVVAFADGSRAPGEVVASDPRSDLAVVRVERSEGGGLLPAAEFATELPPVGSLAIAMGNPLGFENSVSAGIVSGHHRAVPGAAAQGAPGLVDLIQTDAPISPGNSGGALVGADGRVIGVNVAYSPPQAGSVSIGFAIPAPTVRDVVEQLLEDATVDHPWLGVQPAQLTSQIAEQFGLATDTGALVIDLAPTGPAAQAGIEPGDVIVAVDDQPVEAVEELLSALRQREVGDQVTVHVLRGDEEQAFAVTLGDVPQP